MSAGLQAHRTIAAYHEAGHAVAVLLLGFCLVKVCIDRHRPGAGQTFCLMNRSYTGRYGAARSSAPSHWARTLSEAQRQTVIALAGPVAEAIFLGKPLRTLGSIGDLEEIHQLLREPERQGFVPVHGAVRPGAKRFFTVELHRTRLMLKRPAIWRAVSMLAHDLLSWGELSGPDVAETMQWVFADFRQMGLFTGMNSGQCLSGFHAARTSASPRLAA